MLIWRPKLEIRLEVHLSSLFQEMPLNHLLHILPLLLREFLLFFHSRLQVFLLKVLEYKLFFRFNKAIFI